MRFPTLVEPYITSNICYYQMNAIRTNFQIDRERKNGNDLSEQSYVMATGKLKNKSVNQHSIET